MLREKDSSLASLVMFAVANIHNFHKQAALYTETAVSQDTNSVIPLRFT